MASGDHTLQQQKGSLESSLKLLVNADLKEICKANNYQVSGNKQQLQQRCLEILDTIVKSGDRAKFEDLSYRVAHHGAAPPRTSNLSTANHQSLHGSYSNNGQMTPGYQRHGNQSRPTNGKLFKSSPFYAVLDVVVQLQELPEMPQNRHTVKANLSLSSDHSSRLRDDKSLRLLLYCGVSPQQMSIYNPVDVAFPNQLEVKINGDDVKSNFKGLKNKSGTTKPADITDKVRKTANYSNQIQVTYALTTKRYAFVVHLARYISPDALTRRIQESNLISKQKVLEEMNHANSDPDLAATSSRMSLRDPVSRSRINVPVRSSVCKHNQCFDCNMFLQLQDQAPQWNCPVCNKTFAFESLCVDKYFEDILQKTALSIDKVDIEPNGDWTVIKEEEEFQTNGHSRSNGRASYDDDFDDELVEIADAQPNPTIVTPVGAPPASSHLSSAVAQHLMSTPSLSSREASVAQSIISAPHTNKRPASSVIDLTLSDEDEPPRPAKRQNIQHSSSTQSIGTPASLAGVISASRPPSNSAGHGYNSPTYPPPNNPGPALGTGRSVSTSNLRTTQHAGGNLAGAPQSSVRTSLPSTSAQRYAGTNNVWAPPPPPPSTSGQQPYTARPSHPSAPPAQSGSTPSSPNSAYQLPPLPDSRYSAGWRSDRDDSFSSSPPL